MGGSGKKLTVTTPSDREILMTRVFDAPRDLVFEAHSSCEHMSNWWGPRKYEFASCEIDFRPGGKGRIVHRALAARRTKGSTASSARSFGRSTSCGRSNGRACPATSRSRP